MAKRRRRTTDDDEDRPRKKSKSEKGKSDDGTERRGSKLRDERRKAYQRRQDLTSLGVLIIIVLGILGGYYYYDRYYHSSSDGNDDNIWEPTINPDKPDNPNPNPNKPNTLVKMEIRNYGTLTIELYDSIVPETVENFIHYVNTSFFDGLIFHRIVNQDGGMQIIQGGGFYPGTKWNQKSTTKDPINLEIDDRLKHDEGAIAMARTEQKNSATSQFYICIGNNNHFLDGNYAVFGKVTSGMEHVKSINKVSVDEDSWPLEDIVIERAYLSN